VLIPSDIIRVNDVKYFSIYTPDTAPAELLPGDALSKECKRTGGNFSNTAAAATKTARTRREEEEENDENEKAAIPVAALSGRK